MFYTACYSLSPFVSNAVVIQAFIFLFPSIMAVGSGYKSGCGARCNMVFVAHSLQSDTVLL
jgi:hypothetical protein